MNSLDIAHTFFARMDARDANGVLALVTPHAKVTLVPLNLQGDAGDVGRRYFEQLASAFPDLSVVRDGSSSGTTILLSPKLRLREPRLLISLASSTRRN